MKLLSPAISIFLFVIPAREPESRLISSGSRVSARDGKGDRKDILVRLRDVR